MPGEYNTMNTIFKVVLEHLMQMNFPHLIATLCHFTSYILTILGLLESMSGHKCTL